MRAGRPCLIARSKDARRNVFSCRNPQPEPAPVTVQCLVRNGP
jgi:hypothetical protein